MYYAFASTCVQQQPDRVVEHNSALLSIASFLDADEDARSGRALPFNTKRRTKELFLLRSDPTNPSALVAPRLLRSPVFPLEGLPSREFPSPDLQMKARNPICSSLQARAPDSSSHRHSSSVPLHPRRMIGRNSRVFHRIVNAPPSPVAYSR